MAQHSTAQHGTAIPLFSLACLWNVVYVLDGFQALRSSFISGL